MNTTTPPTRPTEADAVICSVMRTFETLGCVAAQRIAGEALDHGRITPTDYLWLVRWTEGRA